MNLRSRAVYAARHKDIFCRLGDKITVIVEELVLDGRALSRGGVNLRQTLAKSAV